MEPHVTSQPWLLEAVGTGEWTGAPLAPLLEQAGLLDDAVEVVFEGLDRGLEGGDEQTYGRSLTIEQALQDGAILAYELNGAPLPSQHGYPLRLVVPGWYGMTNVKWLSSITAVSEPFAGYQQAQSYRWRREQHEVGRPVTRMMPRALMAPPGIPEFIAASAPLPPGAGCGAGAGLVRVGADRAGRVLGRRRRQLVGGGAGRSGRPARLARLVGQLAAGRDGPVRAVLPRHRRDRRHPAAVAGVEPGRLREQRRPARPRGC
jgi:hypothetical protein